MKRIKLFKIVSAVVVGMALALPTSAQYFSGSHTKNTVDKRPENPQEEVLFDKKYPLPEKKNKNSEEARFSVVEKTLDDEKASVHKNINQPLGITKKRKKTVQKKQEKFRRYTKVGGVIVETDQDHQEDELIFLKMTDFDIYQSPSGQTRCSARFSIVSTLPVKISNISYRLKWQKMSTVLTFNDVQPGIDNYYNYELLGDGCYTMDKRPNIVVNRCRAKGMTQRECAGRIRWMNEI